MTASLIDPKDLTTAERKALEAVQSVKLTRRTGGYRNPNGQTVSLKIAAKLESLRLVRAVHDQRRAAHTLVATGLGLTILEIIRQRRERKAQ